jgi:hypothetical protein
MPPIAPPDPATLDDLTPAEQSSLEALQEAGARESGYSACSSAAKCPPLAGSFQCRMSV